MPPASPIDSFDVSEHLPGGEDKPALREADRHQQRTFEDAAQAIAGGKGACSSDSTPFGVEIRNLEEWAGCQGALIPDETVDRLPVVSDSTSEHQVFYRPEDSRAVKRTWAGVYGQIPVAGEGCLERRNATPSEYLTRMALHIAVFGSDLRLEGVTISKKPSMIIGQPSGQPSIVISQPWYEKAGIATNEAIHDLLVGEGFRSVPSSYFGWYRPQDGVVIVDAKPDNFIRTPAGVIPIDLQMALFSQEELKRAGLDPHIEAPVIFIPR